MSVVSLVECAAAIAGRSRRVKDWYILLGREVEEWKTGSKHSGAGKSDV